MKKIKPILLLDIFIILLCCLSNLGLHAQDVFEPSFDIKDTTLTHILVLSDKSQLEGTILAWGDSTVSFQIEEMLYTLSIDEIERIKSYPIDRYLRKLKQDSNYLPYVMLFNQASAPNKKGTGIINTNWTVYNTFDYYFTDNFSAGVGQFFAIGLEARLKYATTLFDGVNIGGGVRGFGFPGIGNDRAVNLTAIYFADVTVGYRNRFANFSVARLNIPLNNRRLQFNIFTAGGSYAIGKRWRMSGEFFVLPVERFDIRLFLTSLNSAWIVRNNKFEFGFVGIPFEALNQDTRLLVPIPMVGYSKQF